MHKKYKLKDKIFFYLYNIIFSSFFTSYLYFVFTDNYIVSKINYYINKDIPTEIDVHIITILCLWLIFWLIFLFIKFSFFSLIYRYTKNYCTKDILENIAIVKLKEKIIKIFKIILFDIYVAVISILINSIVNYIIVLGNYDKQITFGIGIQILNEKIIESIGTQILCVIYSLGGVLPCYLSFLLWYKITHRKKAVSGLDEK